ncbi:MAG TPA: ABC transporter substrate-binding protein [Burkholderiaceae bacterium]|nr:ABC transporter substrate-binding protein [Burkholderiaceae bacterium]
MHRRTSLLLAFALVLPLAAARAAEPTKLRVGVEGAYPPFSSVGPDGQIKGFDIDIAKALCEQIKARCTLVQLDFDGMIPALQSRKIDMIVASMSITPERLKVVDFSDKYYATPNRLIAKAGSGIDGTPAGFKGRKIGVQRATIHDRYATAKFTGATIVRYGKQDEIYLDLSAGRIDATLVDGVAGNEGFLKTPAGKGFAFVGPSYDDPEIFGKGAGIAVRKSDTELRDKLSAAIKAIRASGTYKQIGARYFDFDIYGQ